MHARYHTRSVYRGALVKAPTQRTRNQRNVVADVELDTQTLIEAYIDEDNRNALGNPVIRNSRICVRIAATQVRMGEDMHRLYPHIDPRAYEAALLWVDRHPSNSPRPIA